MEENTFIVVDDTLLAADHKHRSDAEHEICFRHDKKMSELTSIFDDAPFFVSRTGKIKGCQRVCVNHKYSTWDSEEVEFYSIDGIDERDWLDKVREVRVII